MSRGIRVLFVIVFFLSAMVSITVEAYAGPSPYDDPVLATYTGPNGIKIISHHPKWVDKAKLKSVWDELMRNTHFEEIKYFKQVDIYQGDYVSMYYGGVATRTWSDGRQEKYFADDGRIAYFPDPHDGSETGMAHTLAHEYGHHFTLYYLWKKEKVSLDDSSWKKSNYARIRGLTSYPQVGVNAEHEWQPAEIAAADYIQLFGSPNARKIIQFKGRWTGTYSTYMYNFCPQENMNLPLAAQVPGLYEYWLKLAGQPTANINVPPTAPVLALTNVKESGFFSRTLIFQWNRGLDNKNNPISYTLLEYDSPDENLGYPVAFSVNETKAERLVYDSENGIKYYRVLAADPEGMIVSSNLLKVDLQNPQVQKAPQDLLFRDVPPGFWAEEAIAELVGKGILRGYADNTFKPSKKITRAEFAVTLCNLLGLQPESAGWLFADTVNHWARGYIAAVREAGLIQGYAGNLFRPDKQISRAEAAVIISKALNLTDSSPEVPADVERHWAREAVARVLQAHIMTGYPDGAFGPDMSLSRAETAALLVKTAI